MAESKLGMYSFDIDIKFKNREKTMKYANQIIGLKY